MNKIKPRLIVVLTVIMLCSAVVLTYLYQVTNPIIEARAEREQKEAILKVLPGAEEYEEVTKGDLTLYKGIDSSGNTVGYAVQNSAQGFQSVLEIMIGMDIENNKVIKVRILNQAETPGLGARIVEDQFKSQFNDKSFSDSFKAKEDIDAISGATISSQAMADAIKDATNKVKQAYEGGGE